MTLLKLLNPLALNENSKKPILTG